MDAVLSDGVFFFTYSKSLVESHILVCLTQVVATKEFFMDIVGNNHDYVL